LLALEDIYDEHVWRVYAFFAYRLGSREDAEDLTQSTFERAARALRRYDAQKGSPLTWLLAIANNLLIDHFRRQSSDRLRPLEDGDLERPGLSEAPFEGGSLGLDPDLAMAIAQLTAREREIIALRFGADLSGPEIAELKGLTLVNVQQILSRSLRRMRTLIEQNRAPATSSTTGR
jgi:RNA polymerase sigma-70 factor (ECF subfamily)